MVLLLVMLSPAFSQELANPPNMSLAQEQPSDYRLGPADVLEISVIGVKEYTQPNKSSLTIEVSNSGKIHAPFVGVITVNGLTPSELEAEMARRLREKDMLKDPWVTVRVSDYRAHTIYIIGEVMQAGQFYLRNETYLMDLIGISQGIPTDGTMYLYRRAPALPKGGVDDSESPALTGETTVADAIKIDIKELAEGKRPDQNYKLQGGDVLYVPLNQLDIFYIVGEVNNPGSFTMPLNRQILFSQAISQAGGPTKTAKMSQGLLVRYDAAGVRKDIAVDFAAILKGKEPDLPISPNDIIYVPGSNAKTLGYGLLNIIPGLATRTFVVF